MVRSMACLLAASSAIVAVLITLSSGVEAAYPTVTKACKEVADADKRISYAFCVAELSTHYQPGFDGWYRSPFIPMATSALWSGVDNARNATDDDVQALRKTTKLDARARTAVEKCWESYVYIGDQFDDAKESLDGIFRPAAAKERVGRAVSEALRCDDKLAGAGLRPSPLARRRKYAVDIGIISTAMIDRIPVD